MAYYIPIIFENNVYENKKVKKETTNNERNSLIRQYQTLRQPNLLKHRITYQARNWIEKPQ